MTIAFDSIQDVVGNITMASTVLSVADSALGEIKDTLTKIRSLAVTASLGELSQSEIKYLERVQNLLVSDVQRIATTTEVNGFELLESTFVGKSFQVGFAESNRIFISFPQAMTAVGLAINDIALDCTGCIEYTFVKVDYAIDTVNKERAEIQGLQYRIENAKSNLENLVFNLCVDQCLVRESDKLFSLLDNDAIV